MPQAATYLHLASRPRLRVLRMLIWIEEPRFQGFGCSECVWTFHPSGPPEGNSFLEMKENYLRRRDQDFAGHVCTEHARAKMAKIQRSHAAPLCTVRLGRGTSTGNLTPAAMGKAV